MIPIIAHIYGPIFINSYGLAIALSLLLFSWLFLRHPKRSAIISTEHFYNLITICVLAGIIGARILYILSIDQALSIREMLSIHEGGLSFLGGLIAILLVVPLYLRSIKVPLLPLLDLAALYAPLIYTGSRIGCFMAGCCYGITCSSWYSIVYTHPATHAPLFIPLLPTQLISAFSGILIFLVLQYLSTKKIVKIPGIMLGSYLLLTSLERFIIDFWRADRLLIYPDHTWQQKNLIPVLSVDQWIALSTGLLAVVFLIFIKNYKNKNVLDRKKTHNEHI